MFAKLKSYFTPSNNVSVSPPIPDTRQYFEIRIYWNDTLKQIKNKLNPLKDIDTYFEINRIITPFGMATGFNSETVRTERQSEGVMNHKITFVTFQNCEKGIDVFDEGYGKHAYSNIFYIKNENAQKYIDLVKTKN